MVTSHSQSPSKIKRALLMAGLSVGLLSTPHVYNYITKVISIANTNGQIEQIEEELEQIKYAKNRYIMEYSEMKMHDQLIHSQSGEAYGFFSTGEPRYPQQVLSVSNYHSRISKLESQENELNSQKDNLLHKLNQ